MLSAPKHSYGWFVVKWICREGISCSFLDTVHSTEFSHSFSQQNALRWMKNYSRSIIIITLLMFCDFSHLKSDQQHWLQKDPGIVWSNSLSVYNIFCSFYIQAHLPGKVSCDVTKNVCQKIEVTNILEYPRSLGLEYQLPGLKSCLHFNNFQNLFWIVILELCIT
jgi:hypothetical protein